MLATLLLLAGASLTSPQQRMQRQVPSSEHVIIRAANNPSVLYDHGRVPYYRPFPDYLCFHIEDTMLNDML